MLQQYQNQAYPVLAELMREESITYSVLMKILQGPCRSIFTDHENVVVCYSGPPYPVWAWCRDPEAETAVMEIAVCLKEQLPLDTVRSCIMPAALAERLKRADGYFRDARPGMGLLSYRLDEINQVHYPCDGGMGLVREEEIPGLIGPWHDMHMEMEGMDQSREHCGETISRMVNEQNLFAWRNNAGEIVALTARGNQGKYSKITSVYTIPEHRRKGYAINLVHGVTKTILEDGLIPILYTDAAYIASNNCYQKIGYRQVGSLVSICK